MMWRATAQNRRWACVYLRSLHIIGNFTSVIDQQFERSSRAVTEDKQRTGERILLPSIATERRQRVDAFPVLRCTAKPELCAVHDYAEFCRAESENRLSPGIGTTH